MSSSDTADVDAAMADAPQASTSDVKAAEPPQEESLPEEILKATPDELQTRTRLLENDIKIMRSEHLRLKHEESTMKEKIKDNTEKIKQNKVLPYLVGNVVEVSVMKYEKRPDADIYTLTDSGDRPRHR
jgi:26S proteasome regulatory subunit T5